jgi:hypothetical protein
VRYLVSFRKETFVNFRVHGGTTADEIRHCIAEAERLAARQSRDVVVFFDEVNCASHMDMFKEVLCDRRLDGRAVHPGVKVIAACNPYLKLPQSAIDKQEAMGLGFRSNDSESLDGIPLRHLVYRVSKLPDSMLHHIWDFGSLSDSVENDYIASMIDRESALRPGSSEARCFSLLIQKSQSFMRRLKDESSFVSMRDYRERAIPIRKFFETFLIQAKDDISQLIISDSWNTSSDCAKQAPILSDLLRSILLCLSVAYESRLSDVKCLQAQIEFVQ